MFPDKDNGLIVDYVGVFRNLEKALAIYDDAARDGWGKRDGAWLPAYWPNRGQR